MSGSIARPDVHQALADQPAQEGPLVLPLADHARLELLRVHVPVRERDVQISGDDEPAPGRANLPRPAAERPSRNRSLAA